MAKKTFTGETMKEAMSKVKAAVGDEALILSSREIKKKTLTQKGLYEVVVEDGMVNNKRNTNKVNNHSNDDVLLKISEAAKKIKNLDIEEMQDNSSFNINEVKELKKEIKGISDTIKLLQNSIWNLNSSKRENLVIPPEFSEIYAISKNSGINKEHLDEIMSLTLKHMPLKMKQNSVTIKRYFYTLLKRIIHIRQEREISLGMKKIMMFVGPTGVGKTTTIAKLAARFAFKKQKKYKVGIITLDTYRIGAVEQLMTYARMMKLSIEAVVDPTDFIEALNRLRNNDIILIDTVGSSQHDKEKIDKLNSFLSVNTFASIDVNLVLSVTTKFEDLKDIYENFSILPLDTLIFTKLDESKKVGNIFSLIYDLKKPISYFSIGQEVPDDLIEASSEFLIDKMLKDVEW